MTWDSVLFGLIGGMGGSVLTMYVQGRREAARKARMAQVCRQLLFNELSALWFDLTGSVLPMTAVFFPRLTDIWDTYKALLPDLLTPEETAAVARAYASVKDFSVRHDTKALFDYDQESARARDVVEAARVLLAMRLPGSVVAPQSEAGSKSA